MAPTNSKSAMSIAVVPPSSSVLGAAWKTSVKSRVPKVTKMSIKPIKNPKSPMRLTTKAFMPASAALFFSNQKPMRR